MYKLLMPLIIIFGVFCSGCSNEKNTESNKIVLTNGNREITFKKQPQRLVTLRQHITETALEMNLDKYIVGCSDIIDPPVAEHLQDRYKKLNIIAEKYPTLEVLLLVEPDIIWVDRKWAFVKNQLGSMENIERKGIKVYLSESGFHDTNNIEYVYEDIDKMGRLFNEEIVAKLAIEKMQSKINNVQEKIKGIEGKVRVLDYDSSRNNLAFVGCRCMADELIKLAGGVNIFNDIDKEWATVNWEEIMVRNPDVIIVHEFRGVTGLSKIEVIKKNPLLQEVNAVKNNRFIVVNLDEIYEGVRNAQTVENLAKEFYPEKFI